MSAKHGYSPQPMQDEMELGLNSEAALWSGIDDQVFWPDSTSLEESSFNEHWMTYMMTHELDDVMYSEAVLPENTIQATQSLEARARSHQATAKATQTRHTQGQIHILRTWINTHLDAPYPDVLDCATLVSETGLSKKQVLMYISNFRRRHLPRSIDVQGVSSGWPLTSEQEQVCLASEEIATGSAPANAVSTWSPSSIRDASNSSLEVRAATPPILRNDDTQSSDSENETKEGVYEIRGVVVSLRSFRGSLLDWYLVTSDHPRLDEGSLGTQQSVPQAVKGMSWSFSNTFIPNGDDIGRRAAQASGSDWYIRTSADLELKNPTRPDGLANPQNARDTSTTSTPFDLKSTSEGKKMPAILDIKTPHYSFLKSPYQPIEAERDWKSESGSSGSSSAHSGSSYASLGSRKGRRAYYRQEAGSRVHENGKTPYQCNHCAKSFKTRYLRDRHKGTIHEAKRKWICRPRRLHAVIDFDVCPICFAYPNGCQHRVLECWARTEQERTFLRKDLMKQHLLGFHQCNKEEIHPKTLDYMEVEITEG